MRVLVGTDENTVARAAAALIAERQPNVLGVATGSSPMSTYRELVRERSLSDDVHLCLLDEYVGLAPEDPHRYRSVIIDQLAAPLGLPDHHVYRSSGSAATVTSASTSRAHRSRAAHTSVSSTRPRVSTTLASSPRSNRYPSR